jgi:hypothetical protein
MKLYFYKMNTDERYEKAGITVQICEAEEKPKTYKSADRVFSNCRSTARKDDVGRITDFNRLFLTEPNFEYAKEKFKKRAESRIAKTKECLEKEEKN